MSSQMKSHSLNSNAVAETVYKFYNSLPKGGKPCSPSEWTTLASFLTFRDGELVVVSCATGTRCLGRSLLDKTGGRLHDSHAEVLARRSFQCYLMSEVKKAYSSSSSSIFTLCHRTQKVYLKPAIEIVFFTTQTPCGDASIFVRPAGDVHSARKRKLSPSDPEVPLKQASKVNTASEESPGNVCTSDDIYRTGAKCVSGTEQDKHMPGVDYHVTGVLRTKPGRGDPTLSLSCSDKIARWNVLGCQGCFPMIFLRNPVYVDHIVVAGCTYDEQSMHRAVCGRFSEMQLTTPFTLHNPSLLYTNSPFLHCKQTAGDNTSQPCPTALISYRTSEKEFVTEVCINGYRQGVTKKNLHTAKARLSTCRRNMFIDLHELYASLPEETRLLLLQRLTLPKQYISCKKLVNYTSVWKQLVDEDKLFKQWLRKDENYSYFELD